MPRSTSIRAPWLTATSIFLVALAIASWPQRAAAQSTIPSTASYSCDFENSYCDFNEQSALGDAPPATRRSSIVTPGRSGGFAVKLHTESGDSNVHGSGTWERDDLSKSPDASYCNEGQEEWWAVSVMYPSDYVFPAVGQGGVFVDFHHNSSSGLPNFSIEARGESGLRISGYGGAALNGGQYRVQIADPYGAVNNVTRNVWYDYVLHIRWSSSGNGLSEAWLNGKKILAYSGATLYSGISCYLKLANYHDATGSPSSVIYDRVIRGHSAADVALGPLDSVVTTGSTGSSGGSTTPATGSTTPTPATGGTNQAASATMDSSNYSAAAGTSVTFTARILGSGATPTGSVSFASDGGTIAGCSGIALASGVAQCTTAGLPSGTHKVTGAYSGDSSYLGAQAGPITQTVTGSSVATPVSTLPATFGMDSSSYTINAGQGVTFTATVPGSGGTVAFYDNGASIAGCTGAPVSNAGIATCTTTALTAAGAHAITGVYSGAGSYSAGVAGPITETVQSAIVTTTQSASSLNVGGLWWGAANGSESGWGVNLVQQGSVLFATWYTYDHDGSPMWLVMPDAQRSSDGSWSGTLYRTTGPSYRTASFDPSQVGVTPVGSATFAFTDTNNGRFSANVGGAVISKALVREVYDAVPTCSADGTPTTSNFQDLWWRTSGAESGWGLQVTQQGNTVFLAWFTYDDNGKGLWLVASNMAKTGTGTFSGALYQTTGPAFDAGTWDPSQVGVTQVGTATLAFSGASSGTFTANVNGSTIVKPIAREVFASPATTCR